MQETFSSLPEDNGSLKEANHLSEWTEKIIPNEIEEKLEWVWLKRDEIVLFEDFLKNNPDKQEEVLKVIETVPTFKIKLYIRRNGFIINDTNRVTYTKNV
jgi:hypothetical protein